MTIVSRILTDPKTALAGVTLETSFARFMVSMAMFNEVRVLSRPLGRWGLAAIVGTKSVGEKTVLRAQDTRKGPRSDRDRRPSYRDRSHGRTTL